MNYELIKPYIEKKLVSEQSHPENPDVRIFNYTQHCQFSGEWDDVTKQCRGLIMNVKTGEVLARPFPKFFNLGEHINKCWPIPSEIPVVTEKLDGSLGILYWLGGHPWIATRGSFTSDQAIWATKWWRENYGKWSRVGDEKENEITRLFEIIYPENRIVVNYDFSGLVHIASIDTKTGVQVLDDVVPCRSVKKIDAISVTALSKLDEPNSEGFVVYYPIANVRMKIKFPEYVRLHKLVTGVSEIAIWEHLRDGNGLHDLIEKVPDEFMKWVEKVENRLRAEHAKLWGEAQMALQMIGGLDTRKEKAQWIMQNARGVSGIVFSLLDEKEKEASRAVWNMVRPRGQSSFKVDIDL